jgi:hypothetical protein
MTTNKIKQLKKLVHLKKISKYKKSVTKQNNKYHLFNAH